MADAVDPTLLVLARMRPTPAVEKALASAAGALGHTAGLAVRTLDAAGEGGLCSDSGRALEASDSEALALYIERVDPWAVVAIDEPAIEALRRAFGDESASLSPDRLVEARGYTLVAVPGFAACLDDQQAKRVAWHRLKAARHPQNPLD